MQNSHAILGYPLLVISGLELLLGLILLQQNQRNSPSIRLVAVLAFISASFSLCTGIMYVQASLGYNYNFFVRLNWIGWFTLVPALQYLYQLGDDRGETARWIGWLLYPVWGIAFILSLFTDLIVTRSYRLIPFMNHPGVLERPFRLFGAFLALWIIVKIVMLRRTASGLLRREINYYYIGVLIFGGGAGLTAGLLQQFGGFGFEPGLSSYFSLPWVALTFYAIARYELFDIRQILSRSIAVILLLMILGTAQAAMFMIVHRSLGPVLGLFTTLVFVAVLFFATPLRIVIQKLVDRVVLRERYHEVLVDASRALSTILGLEDLLGSMLQSVERGLKVRTACVFLREGGGRLMASRCLDPGEKLPDQALPDAAAGHLERTKQPIIREIQTALLPEPGAAALLDALQQVRTEIIVPIFHQGVLRGALGLGAKGDGRSYTQTDIVLLEMLAGHAGIAIANATLFTEVSRAKESLQKSEEQFRSLTETIPAGIFIHQGEKFVYVNPAGLQLSGYTWEEMQGMDFWHIVHPEFRELVRERAMKRLAGEQTPQQYEMRFNTKNGEVKWVLLHAERMEFQGKMSVIGVMIDITERKNFESKLRYMQKMEAIGKVAGGIAHDFNNILATIVGHSNMLHLVLPAADPNRKHVASILEATERAASLTQRLLTFGSRKESSLQACDLADLVGRQEAFLVGALPPTVRLSVTQAGSPLPVLADPRQIERVLMNLIVNARDAMHGGGEIVLATGSARIDAAFVRTHGFGEQGPYAFITVKDTGAGMDESVRSRIFEPFFTTKAAGRGTGFGLSVVYEIVKEHKGYIVVSSEPGKGALFAIYLPLVEEAVDPAIVSAAAAAPASQPVPPPAGRTILLADDDEGTRRFWKSVLEEHGLSVIEAENGEVAIRKFQETPDAVHLVVSDLIMPRKNGREVYDAIRAIRPQVRFLFTSGYSRELLVRNGMIEQDHAFLAKPCNRADILNKTSELLMQ